MRIRHVACIAPPRLGGMGNAALRQVEALRARGHEVELVVPDVPGASAYAGIRPWPTRGFWGNAAVLAQANDLFVDVDVVHLHYPFYGTAERLLWRTPSVPVVLQFHMDAAAHDWREWIFRAHRFFVQSRLVRHAKAVIVASRDYANHSSMSEFLQRHPEMVHEVPFFLNEQRYVPPTHRETSEQLRCLFVGALDRAHEFKGLTHIIEAVAQVPWASLVLVGEGNRRKALEDVVRQRGLQARVQFVGRLSEEQLIRAYQSVDVLLFPSTSKAEAFGLVALEAQACGTPVIASALPGVREVVLHEKTGLLIEPGSVGGLVNAMQRLHQSPELRLQYGLAAREHVVGRFAQARVLDQLEEVYQRVCVSRS